MTASDECRRARAGSDGFGSCSAPQPRAGLGGVSGEGMSSMRRSSGKGRTGLETGGGRATVRPAGPGPREADAAGVPARLSLRGGAARRGSGRRRLRRRCVVPVWLRLPSPPNCPLQAEEEEEEEKEEEELLRRLLRKGCYNPRNHPLSFLPKIESLVS